MNSDYDFGIWNADFVLERAIIYGTKIITTQNIKHINKDFQYNIHQAVNNDENLSGQ